MTVHDWPEATLLNPMNARFAASLPLTRFPGVSWYAMDDRMVMYLPVLAQSLAYAGGTAGPPTDGGSAGPRRMYAPTPCRAAPGSISMMSPQVVRGSSIAFCNWPSAYGVSAKRGFACFTLMAAVA